MARVHLTIVILLSLLSLGGCAPSQHKEPQCHPANAAITKEKDSKSPTLLSHSVITKIDAVVAESMTSANGFDVPGCGLAVTVDDTIALLKTYGQSRLSPNQHAFGLDTIPAIGSISKTYTALATIKLMEDGKISSLLAPATLYIDGNIDLPWSEALIQDLLSHTGGLNAFPAWDLFNDLASMQSIYPDVKSPSLKPRLVLQGFMNNPANVLGPPAKGQSAQPIYSNVGYTILGAIIDELATDIYGQASQQGYEHYVWREIARGNAASEPASPALCMGASIREQSVPTLATGYTPTGNELNFSDSTQDGWGWAGPAGGWWATIGDLARLMLVLQSDLVVSQQNIKNIMRKDFGALQPNLGNASMRVGIGLELSPISSTTKWYGKGGHIAGYSAHFRIWPGVQNDDERNFGVALACNRGSMNGDSLNKIYSILHASNQTLFAQPDPDIQVLQRALAPFVSVDDRIDETSIALLTEHLSRTHEGRLLLEAIEQHNWTHAKHLIARYMNGTE